MDTINQMNGQFRGAGRDQICRAVAYCASALFAATCVFIGTASDAAEQVSEATTWKMPTVTIPGTKIEALELSRTVEYRPSRVVFEEQTAESYRRRQTPINESAERLKTVTVGTLGIMSSSRTTRTTPSEAAAKIRR